MKKTSPLKIDVHSEFTARAVTITFRFSPDDARYIAQSLLHQPAAAETARPKAKRKKPHAQP